MSGWQRLHGRLVGWGCVGVCVKIPGSVAGGVNLCGKGQGSGWAGGSGAEGSRDSRGPWP